MKDEDIVYFFNLDFIFLFDFFMKKNHSDPISTG